MLTPMKNTAAVLIIIVFRVVFHYDNMETFEKIKNYVINLYELLVHVWLPELIVFSDHLLFFYSHLWLIVKYNHLSKYSLIYLIHLILCRFVFSSPWGYYLWFWTYYFSFIFFHYLYHSIEPSPSSVLFIDFHSPGIHLRLLSFS